ncbi:MAG: DNA gyrase modulator, partial [Myxococcota bacterium]
MAPRYLAPFAEGGSAPIGEDECQRLLNLAMAGGADYADLYFEYSVSGSYGYDEGILKSAGRYVSMGLGVRVMKGDATGYAYVQDFSPEGMAHAAKTAAQIASAGGAPDPVGLKSVSIPSRYPVEMLSLDAEGIDKRALLQCADEAARAADSRIVRVNASLSEELREILVATSTGRFVRDRQPLIRFGVSAVAEDGDKRQSGSSGGGGRFGLDYFESHSPEHHAAEATRQALAMLDAR